MSIDPELRKQLEEKIEETRKLSDVFAEKQEYEKAAWLRLDIWKLEAELRALDNTWTATEEQLSEPGALDEILARLTQIEARLSRIESNHGQAGN